MTTAESRYRPSEPGDALPRNPVVGLRERRRPRPARDPRDEAPRRMRGMPSRQPPGPEGPGQMAYENVRVDERSHRRARARVARVRSRTCVHDGPRFSAARGRLRRGRAGPVYGRGLPGPPRLGTRPDRPSRDRARLERVWADHLPLRRDACRDVHLFLLTSRRVRIPGDPGSDYAGGARARAQVRCQVLHSRVSRRIVSDV